MSYNPIRSLRQLAKIGRLDRLIPSSAKARRRRQIAQALAGKSITPQVVSASSGKTGRPVFANFDYKSTVDNSLHKSVWVYRCVTLIALAVASVPIKTQRSTDGGATWEDALDSRLQELIDSPNEQWAWGTFMIYLSYYMLLGGETFITKIRTSRSLDPSASVDGEGIPIALWPHKSDTFNPVPGKPGEPFVKEYSLAKRAAERVKPDDMIHLLRPDPDDVYRGLSPLKAGNRAVETDTNAQDWQNAFFDHAAVPTGILKLPGDYNDEQWQESVDKFESRYSSSKNAGRIMIWSDEVEFTSMSRTAVESDYLGTRQQTRTEICATFGVPPQLVGIMEFSTLNNFQTSELVFWKLTALPHLLQVLGELNRHLAPEFETVDGGRMRLVADVSKVDALFQLFEQRWAVAKQWLELGVPWDIVNERFDLGLIAFPGSEVGLVPVNKIPISSFSEQGASGGDA